MARTIKPIQRNQHTDEEIYRIADQILQRNGFLPKMLPEGRVWGKGDGTWIKQQNFAIHFESEIFVMEAWLKDNLTGESDLTGFTANIPKKKMREILDEIERAVQWSKGSDAHNTAPVGQISVRGQQGAHAFCGQCGAKLIEGAKFCVKCGAKTSS